MWSYGANKRMEKPWHMVWTGLTGKTEERIKKNQGWANWQVLPSLFSSSSRG
jgi:hypothetical protein